MKRALRYGLILLVILSGIGALVWEGWRFLQSRKVANEVAARLSDTLGIPVRIQRVHPGLKSSSLEGLQLFQPGSDASGQPWATVDRVVINDPAWNLLTSKGVPHGITLEGVQLTLNLDERGNALTRLPSRRHVVANLKGSQNQSSGRPQRIFPNLHIKGGSVLLHSQDHPDIEVGGIEAELESNAADHLLLAGTVDDPYWGHWSIRGTLDRQAQSGTASAKTLQPLHVSPAKLARIPFVATEVWDLVQIQGDTPVEVACRFDTAQKKVVHYHAEFAPQGIQLGITPIDLHAGQVTGRATLADDILHLDHLRGVAADGTVQTNGDVEFFHNDVGLNLAVDVDHIDLDLLPKKWSLPTEVSGRLTGHADFQTHLVQGRPAISGQGKGEIKAAQVADFSTRPIPVVMHFDSRGFHFTVPSLESFIDSEATFRAKE